MPKSGKLGVDLTGSILYVGPPAELDELGELGELDDGFDLTGSILYAGPPDEPDELDAGFVTLVGLL